MLQMLQDLCVGVHLGLFLKLPELLFNMFNIIKLSLVLSTFLSVRTKNFNIFNISLV